MDDPLSHYVYTLLNALFIHEIYKPFDGEFKCQASSLWYICIFWKSMTKGFYRESPNEIHGFIFMGLQAAGIKVKERISKRR